jgi:hypothetical protein
MGDLPDPDPFYNPDARECPPSINELTYIDSPEQKTALIENGSKELLIIYSIPKILYSPEVPQLDSYRQVVRGTGIRIAVEVVRPTGIRIITSETLLTTLTTLLNSKASKDTASPSIYIYRKGRCVDVLTGELPYVRTPLLDYIYLFGSLKNVDTCTRVTGAARVAGRQIWELRKYLYPLEKPIVIKTMAIAAVAFTGGIYVNSLFA